MGELYNRKHRGSTQHRGRCTTNEGKEPQSNDNKQIAKTMATMHKRKRHQQPPHRLSHHSKMQTRHGQDMRKACQ